VSSVRLVGVSPAASTVTVNTVATRKRPKSIMNLDFRYSEAEKEEGDEGETRRGEVIAVELYK
jgi:hypothetical protein